jgi:hypothetical protein
MGRTVTVEIILGLKDDDGEGAYGTCKWGEGWIRLEANMEPTAQLHAFFHEVQHLIFQAAGRTKMDSDEGLVDSLGGIWMQAVGSFQYTKQSKQETK